MPIAPKIIGQSYNNTPKIFAFDFSVGKNAKEKFNLFESFRSIGQTELIKRVSKSLNCNREHSKNLRGKLKLFKVL